MALNFTSNLSDDIFVYNLFRIQIFIYHILPRVQNLRFGTYTPNAIALQFVQKLIMRNSVKTLLKSQNIPFFMQNLQAKKKQIHQHLIGSTVYLCVINIIVKIFIFLLIEILLVLLYCIVHYFSVFWRGSRCIERILLCWRKTYILNLAVTTQMRNQMKMIIRTNKDFGKNTLESFKQNYGTNFILQQEYAANLSSVNYHYLKLCIDMDMEKSGHFAFSEK